MEHLRNTYRISTEYAKTLSNLTDSQYYNITHNW